MPSINSLRHLVAVHIIIFSIGYCAYGKQIPVITWWTKSLFPHIESKHFINCTFGTCLSRIKTPSRQENGWASFLFYGTDFDPMDLPLPRKTNHLWALIHEESPMNNYIFSHPAGIRLFNFTSTFSRASDFPLTTQFIPSLQYLVGRKPISTQEKNEYRRRGFAPVMYLQSHCDVASFRDEYVKELMMFIDVDSYGSCLHNKDLPKQLSSTETYNDKELFHYIAKYKFILAYENAICDDYITEKVFRALHVGSVPIYKGSSSVMDWMPAERSVILVDDFSGPEDLARYIDILDGDDTLYNAYLQYKTEGVSNELLKQALLERSWGINDVLKEDPFRAFECFVCDKMHSMKESFSPSVSDRKHMNCFQPHLPLGITQDYAKSLEWIENFWYSFDAARAIELMLQNQDNDTNRFNNYLYQLKYKH